MQKTQVWDERVVFGVLTATSLLFGLLIFCFVHSGFIRDYGGDIVAITFLYSLAVLLFRPKPMIAAAGVMAVAIIIEILQAIVSLPRSAAVDLTLGSTFDPYDILVYGATLLTLLSVDTLWKQKNQFLS